MKRSLALTMALAVLLGLSFQLGRAADQPKRGGTINISLRKDLTLLNPLVGTKSTDHVVRELMFEALVGLDLKGKIQPHLAESWEVSSDGKHYTFKLRRGVKFHNGQEMTAADAKWTMDYTRNPKNAAYGLRRLALVDRVETPNKYSLQIHLKRASPAFLSTLATIQAFSVIPKESLKEGIDQPTTFPPGTGPFKFVEWKPNRRTVYERFDDYWGHKAYLDKIVIRPIGRGSVRLTALRAGDVDLIDRTPYEWVRRIVEGKVKGVSHAGADTAAWRTLKFNVADPPFNNRKLRHAIAYALDKQEILQAAFFRFGDPIDQKYPKGHAWYLEGVRFPSRDLNKAQALLKESGYKGETIKLMAYPGNMEIMGTVLQAQLKKIGINMEIDVLEYGSYTARQRKGDYAFMFYGGSFDADPSTTYSTDLMCEPNLRKRGSNVSGYCDKEMDATFNKAATELDQGKRQALFKQILTKVSEDLPEIYIGFVPRFYAFREYVKNFTSDGEGHFMYRGGGLNYTWLDK